MHNSQFYSKSSKSIFYIIHSETLLAIYLKRSARIRSFKLNEAFIILLVRACTRLKLICYFKKSMLTNAPAFGVVFKEVSTASLGRSQLPESVKVSAGVLAKYSFCFKRGAFHSKLALA